MIFTVYGLVDPSGETRYVGCTSRFRSRISDHAHEAQNSKKRSRKLDWIRSLLKRGLSYRAEVLEETSKDPDGRERYWILEMRQRGNRLTNTLSGSSGAIKKLRALRKAHKRADARFNHSNASKNMSPEVRKRIRAKLQSDAWRKAQSDRVKAWWADPKNHKKRAKAIGAGKRTPAARKRTSKSHKAWWAVPENREKRIKTIREVAQKRVIRLHSLSQ